MKLNIFGSNEWSFTDKKGELVEGVTFYAFSAQGPMQFTAPLGTELKIQKVAGYDEKMAVEVKLLPKLFKGELKWRLDSTPDLP